QATRHGNFPVEAAGEGDWRHPPARRLRIVMRRLHFFRRAKRDRESASDIQFYLDAETDDNLARGMSLEEARAAARRKFGNPALIREEIRDMSSFHFLDAMCQELRQSLRGMRKNPMFAAAAMLTLALGIGANTAI